MQTKLKYADNMHKNSHFVLHKPLTILRVGNIIIAYLFKTEQAIDIFGKSYYNIALVVLKPCIHSLTRGSI